MPPPCLERPFSGRGEATRKDASWGGGSFLKTKTVKTSTLDKYFSLLIRTRSAWRCEFCGKSFEHDPGSLHCSHHVSRRYTAGGLRWHPYNASAHCVSCHWDLGLHPLKHTWWIERYFPEHAAFIATAKIRSTKFTMADKVGLLKHLKTQLQKLQKLQKLQNKGERVEFEAFSC